MRRFLSGSRPQGMACAAFMAPVMLAMALAAVARAGEVEYFRKQGGVATGTGKLPNELSKERLKWRREMLPGNSTPCVVGDAIFLTTYDAEKQQLATVAVDRETGKTRWRQPVPRSSIEKFHPVGSPASCSPASDGRRLYVFFGSYGLICYDLDGQLLWSRKMGPFQDEFGASSSPVLVDGKVILNQDHDVDSHLIALDAESGEEVWKTPRTEFTRSYSTPVIWNQNGEQQIVVAGALQLAAYAPATGKRIWWINGLSRIVDSTPTIVGDSLYLATWTPGGDQTNRIAMQPFDAALTEYDKNGDGQVGKNELPQGAVLTRFFRIDLDQDQKLNRREWDKHASVFARAQNAALAVKAGARGDATESHVRWVVRRGLPTVPSPVVYDGLLYMIKDGGILSNVDVATGKIVKQGRAKGRGNYYASPVAGDGKVYLASERGVVSVIQAGPEWKTIASTDLGERIMATPVLRDGRILIRTDAALYCYE